MKKSKINRVTVLFMKDHHTVIFDDINELLESLQGKNIIISRAFNNEEWSKLNEERLKLIDEADNDMFYAGTDGFKWGDEGASEALAKADNIENKMLMHDLWIITEKD